MIIPPTRLDAAALDSLVSRMRNPDERRGDLRAQLAAHRLAEGRVAELCARRGHERVAAAMDELLAYSERVVRAAIVQSAGRALRRRRRAGDSRRAARDPRRRDDRGRLDRHRLRGNGSAVRREPQLPARRDALGVLLRRALPDRTRPACLRRRLRARHGACSRRLPRQRPIPRRGGRGQHGDVEPDH